MIFNKLYSRARVLPKYTRDSVIYDKNNIYNANKYCLRLNEIY